MKNFFSHLFRRNKKDYHNDSSNRNPVETIVKKIGLRHGDVTSKDFEDAEYDLSQIFTAYNVDGYVRQGVDKYVDQIMKEGYDFYGKNVQAVEYIKLRLDAIAESSQTPTRQFISDICDDVVKYSNCFVAKVRDSTVIPQGMSVTGLDGAEPIGGYFCINATNIKMKRDKNGKVLGYQQETEDSDKPVKFKAEDIIHFYYKKEKGYAFGTPFMWPVLDDIRALRQAEENVLKMMYRNIHPFIHAQVGNDEVPGMPDEIADVSEKINNMEVDGGLVTSNRVNINPIAADKVIDAHPYLKYLEDRVFTGMGIPAILFGRGETSNKSTGDNQTSEMCDRIKAMQGAIEDIFNFGIIRELLLEGGFDPILNPDDNVLFAFKENDKDSKIKEENQIVYLFEHNAITEDEMRFKLNMDPISDRNLLNRELTAEVNARYSASASDGSSSSKSEKGSGSKKETNNKNKPTNQHGSKSSPKRTSDNLLKTLELIDETLKNKED